MFFTHYSLHCPLRISRMLFKFNNLPISRKTIATTPIRSDVFNIGKRMKNELYYKKRDKIEPTFELIYRAPFDYLTAFCRHVPTFNLIAVSSIIAFKLAIGAPVVDSNYQILLGPTMSDGGELLVFVVAFYVVNLVLAYVVTKYPLRIYRSKNQYIAMFEGYLPLLPKQYSFCRGEIGPTKSILPAHESIYKMKDRKVLVFSHHFKKPADFNDMFRK